MELNSKEVLQIYSVFILEWGNQWLIRLVIFVPTCYWRKDNSLKLISHTSTLHVKHTHKTNLQAWCWQQQDVCPVCQEEQGWFSLLRRVKDHLSLVNWQQGEVSSCHNKQGRAARVSQGHCRPQDPITNNSWGFTVPHFILDFSFLRRMSLFLLHTSGFQEWQSISCYCSVISRKLPKHCFGTQNA